MFSRPLRILLSSQEQTSFLVIDMLGSQYLHVALSLTISRTEMVKKIADVYDSLVLWGALTVDFLPITASHFVPCVEQS